MYTSSDASQLLDTLQALAGCAFLSDLHTGASRPALLAVVNDLDADSHSAQAWNYAAAYITTEPCAFADAESARAWLIARLSE